MAYDDIRIGELPSLSSIHNNDLFLIQDVSNGLAHSLDWNRLKNSIGTLSKGIIFPVGNAEEPQIAIGDYTSGIFAEDFGQFAVVTHAEKRININQAGTTEIINGNVVIGNYDRQCFYRLIVNNITTFACDVTIDDNLDVGGNISAGGNITAKDFSFSGNGILGKNCDNILTINSEIRAKCNMDLVGNMDIHKNLMVYGNGTIVGDVNIGTRCDTTTFKIYSPSHFYCDVRIDGDLSLGGDMILDGDVSIGKTCLNEINLFGTTTVHCDFRVFGTTFLDQSLYVQGSTYIDGEINVLEDAKFGTSCNNNITLYGSVTNECDTFMRGDVIIGPPGFSCPGTTLTVNGALEVGCDIVGHQDLKIDHNVEIGKNCSDALLVHSTSTFECDTQFDKNVTIDGDTLIGGDLVVNGTEIHIGDPTILCEPDPNMIHLHGEVHVDCDLFVSGDITFDGNLGLGGPKIELGSGCDITDIILNGEVHILCNTVIDKNLLVKGSTILVGPVECENTLNVVRDGYFDSDLVVHENVKLNRPLLAYPYWNHCCSIPVGENCEVDISPAPITEIFGETFTYCNNYFNDFRWYIDYADDRATHPQRTDNWGRFSAHSRVELNGFDHQRIPSGGVETDDYTVFDHPSDPRDGAITDPGRKNSLQTTTIRGITHSLSEVNLNEPLYYIDSVKADNSGDPYCFNRSGVDPNTGQNFDTYMITNNFGIFNARSEVNLNSASRDNPTVNHTMLTNIWGQIQQYSWVELNKDYINIGGAPPQNFNSLNNDRHTQIHGDLHSNKNVILNPDVDGCNYLTQIKGKLQTQCDVYLNGQFTPGAGVNNDANCNLLTKIQGVQESFCDVYLNGQLGDYTNHTYKDCSKETVVWGHLKVSCSQDFGNENHLNHCEQDTNLHTNLLQDAKVRLNLDLENDRYGSDSECDQAPHIDFNVKVNEQSSIIYGDLDSVRNVHLNQDSRDITQIRGKLQSQWDVWLNGDFNGRPSNNAVTNSKWTPEVGHTNHNTNKDRWTKVLGNQESFHNVYLNGQEGNYFLDTRSPQDRNDPNKLQWKDCSKETVVWGTLKASCDVYFGNPIADQHCQQTTTLHSNLLQDATVQLNRDLKTDRLNASSPCLSAPYLDFNIHVNQASSERGTTVYGDLDSVRNVHLNQDNRDITQIRGKLQSQWDVWLNGDFNGAPRDATTISKWTPVVGYTNHNVNKDRWTKVLGNQESFHNVYLNGQEGNYFLDTRSPQDRNDPNKLQWKDCNKETVVWGNLKAACDVYFGNPIADQHCQQTTTLHSKLAQDATVELNRDLKTDRLNSSSSCLSAPYLDFNIHTNQASIIRGTTVYGDFDSVRNVHLNEDNRDITQIRGKLQTQWDVWLNGDFNGSPSNAGTTISKWTPVKGYTNHTDSKDRWTKILGNQESFHNVYLNGQEGDWNLNGTYEWKDCSKETVVWGTLKAACNVYFGNPNADQHCQQTTTLHSKLAQDATVELNRDLKTDRLNGDSSCLTAPHLDFNVHTNQASNAGGTSIYADLDANRNVHLNQDSNDLTQIRGKLQTQWDVWLNGDFNGTSPGGTNGKWTPEAGYTNHTRSKDRWTKILGNQESFHNVYLNGQEGDWDLNGTYEWKDCNKETVVWGTLKAACDVYFGNPNNNCETTTTLHSNLVQDATVVLNNNTGCCGPSNRNFNDPDNNRCTIIKGDTDIKASVILNASESQSTRINGKLDARHNGRINGNVNLNGGAPGDPDDGKKKTCSRTTDVWGTFRSHCDVILNDNCGETTTIRGNLVTNCNVTLGPGDCSKEITLNDPVILKRALTINGNAGVSTVRSGSAGFFVAAGSNCSQNVWHPAVTKFSIVGSNQTGTLSSIKLETNGTSNGAGDKTLQGWAGDAKLILRAADDTIMLDGTKGPRELNWTANASSDKTISIAVNPDMLPCFSDDFEEGSDGCIKLNSKCVPLGAITTTKITNKDPGVPGHPGIVIGIEGSGFIGFCGSPANKRVRMIADTGWSGADCSASAGSGRDDIAFWERDPRAHKNSCINTGGSSYNVTYDNPDGPARVHYEDKPVIPSPPPTDPSDLQGRAVNFYKFDLPFQLSETTSRIETQSGVPFDAESLLDQLVGTSPTNLGLVEWARLSDQYMEDSGGEQSANPDPFTPVIDANKLASVHPCLAHHNWTPGSYERYDWDGEYEVGLGRGRRLYTDPNDRLALPFKPNYDSINTLLMLAIKAIKNNKASKSGATFTGGVTFDDVVKIDTTTLVDAVDDAAAAAAGVTIDQVYRNGSQLMVRVS